MDEKDRELQELRRKVNDLEERIKYQDYTIVAQQETIRLKSESLIKVGGDYIKLLNGLNDLIASLRGAKPEV